MEKSEVHSDLSSFEKGSEDNDQHIAPSMVYAYAAPQNGYPVCNGAPNLTVDIPALQELAS